MEFNINGIEAEMLLAAIEAKLRRIKDSLAENAREDRTFNVLTEQARAYRALYGRITNITKGEN